jgi:hypothetical protein
MGCIPSPYQHGEHQNRAWGKKWLGFFVASRAHFLLILPDTGFHQPLNQRLAPQVVYHKIFQFLLNRSLLEKSVQTSAIC